MSTNRRSFLGGFLAICDLAHRVFGKRDFAFKNAVEPEPEEEEIGYADDNEQPFSGLAHWESKGGWPSLPIILAWSGILQPPATNTGGYIGSGDGEFHRSDDYPQGNIGVVDKNGGCWHEDEDWESGQLYTWYEEDCEE